MSEKLISLRKEKEWKMWKIQIYMYDELNMCEIWELIEIKKNREREKNENMWNKKNYVK